MRQWPGSALVQVMDCRLFGTKPLPELVLTYCQLDPEKQTSVKFNRNYNISIKKIRLKMSSAKWRSFCPGRDKALVFMIGSHIPWHHSSLSFIVSWRCHDIFASLNHTCMMHVRKVTFVKITPFRAPKVGCKLSPLVSLSRNYVFHDLFNWNNLDDYGVDEL